LRRIDLAQGKENKTVSRRDAEAQREEILTRNERSVAKNRNPGFSLRLSVFARDKI
jgi:hypothetical protein